MKRSCRKYLAAVVAIVSMMPVAHARSVQKPSFFKSSPFGSLALVLAAQTPAKAKSLRIVEDLSSKECWEIDRKPVLYFLLNHFNPDKVGLVSYLSVRIIFESTDDDPIRSRRGVHLYRNANWFKSDGTKDENGVEIPPDLTGISTEDFIALHQADADGEADALEKLKNSVGEWHMRPEEIADSSWKYRSLYAQPIKDNIDAETSGIGARLLRFTATGLINSDEPVLFSITTENVQAVTILVDTPTMPSSDARVRYKLMFGGTCPNP